MQRESWRSADANNVKERSTNGQGVYRIPQRRNPQSRGNWRDRDNENETPRAIQQWKWETKNSDSFHHIDTSKLEEFSNMEPRSISLKISAQKTSFKQLLQSELDYEKIVLVLKILAKLCQSPFITSKSEIINSAFEAGFPTHLLHLVQHLQHKHCVKHNMTTFWNDTKGFFSNLAVLYQFFIYILPSNTYEMLLETLEDIVLNIHSLEFEQEIKVCNESKGKFEQLIAKLMEPRMANEDKLKHEPQKLSSILEKSSTHIDVPKHQNRTKNEKSRLRLPDVTISYQNASTSKIVGNNHRCAKQECEVITRRVLPCSHKYLVACFMDFKDYKCQSPVRAELPCGHVVTDKPCYQSVNEFPCPFPCDTRVEPCGHACVQTCHVSKDPDHVEYKCRKPCTKLKNGCSTNDHYCQLLCFEECSPCEVQKSSTTCSHKVTVPCNTDVRTVKCQEMVEKVLPNCGHTVKSKCCEPPSRKNCRKKCPLILKCSHPCQERCNEPCTTKCRKMIESTPPECGHTFQIECYLRLALAADTQPRNVCQELCRTILACGHLCSGTCSSCAQGRIHKHCERKCGRIMICGHKCTESCHEVCEPCTHKCPCKCKHSACKKTCGEPCASCKEPCTRQCKHVRCIAKCGELCTVGPCAEPCGKLLACGHPCIGFCGDACPPLCRICDRGALTEIFFGNEADDDARFVLLDDCGHVLESWGMDQWLEEGNVCCPKCKVQLASTQRYGDYFKKAALDIIAGKRKVFGDCGDNEQRRLKLLEELENIRKNCGELITDSSSLVMLLEDFKRVLSNQDRRQPFHAALANAYASKIKITGRIVTTFNGRRFKNPTHVKILAKHTYFLLQYLLKQGHKISNQQIQDFEAELLRLSRIVQLYETANSHFTCVVLQNPILNALFNEAVKIAVSTSVYTQRDDKYVTRQLTTLAKSEQIARLQKSQNSV